MKKRKLTVGSLAELAERLPVINRQIQSSIIGGHDYKLNYDGSVVLIRETTDKFDTLIPTNGNSAIQTSKGTLNPFVGNSASATFIADENSRQLFQYLADNSAAEWIYVIDRDGNAHIATDNNLNNIDRYPADTGSCTEVTHSHVAGGSVPSEADLEFAKKYPNMTFQIYFNGKYIKYNSNGIIE